MHLLQNLKVEYNTKDEDNYYMKNPKNPERSGIWSYGAAYSLGS